MADFSCASTKRTSHWLAPISWDPQHQSAARPVLHALPQPGHSSKGRWHGSAEIADWPVITRATRAPSLPSSVSP